MDSPQIGGEVEAALGKMGGEVLGCAMPPGEDGGQGVVHGVHGGGVILLPAVRLPGTVPADPGRGPAEDQGGVAVVVRDADGGVDGLIQPAKSQGGPLQPATHQLLGLQVWARSGLDRSEPGAQAAEGPSGQKEKENTAACGLVPQRAGGAGRRAPQGGGGGQQQPGQGGPGAAQAAEQSGPQGGQTVYRGI